MEFSIKDICNPEEMASYIPDANGKPSTNYYDSHAFILHDHGSVATVVFAPNLQDALDTAVDENKLDQFKIEEFERQDYGTDEQWLTGEVNGVSYLGNASEAYDIESLGIVEMTNDKFFSQLLSAVIDTDK